MQSPDNILNDAEVRVLGSLMEKEMATPEYYPLTLNSLTNACNQKTNREPVVSYDDQIVMTAIDSLRNKKMVRQSSLGRAMKFEQIFSDGLNLITREKAVICILLLRGPQTIGEIRGRTERLYSFPDLEEAKETISNLEEMGLVKKMAMQPGRKEARYTHLLSGEPQDNSEQTPQGPNIATTPYSQDLEDIKALQQQIDSMKDEIDQLRREFAAFKSQFE